MNTMLRNRSVDTLLRIAATLLDRGFRVSPIVIPENEYTGGLPYLSTDAPCWDISLAMRISR